MKYTGGIRKMSFFRKTDDTRLDELVQEQDNTRRKFFENNHTITLFQLF